MDEHFSFQVGGFSCYSLSDGYFEMASKSMAPGLSDSELAAARRRYGLPPGEMQLTATTMLVDTGTARVLVDTGLGESMATAGRLPSALRALGVEPEAVDSIVISHGHLDHVGGLLRQDGTLVFPQARVFLSRVEWDFWSPDAAFPGESDLAARSRAQLARVPDQQVERIEPGDEIVPGVVVHDGSGHTPGHLVVEVTSEGERLWLLGDLVFHRIHVEHPEWPAAPDHDKAASVAARRAWLPRLAVTGDLVHATHMPFPALGRVQVRGDGWGWEPLSG